MDNLTNKQRTKNMKAIKSQSQLENLVTKELWHRGYRFRKNVRSLMGRPDIVIKKYKVVIFIDSCFWHGCPLHGNIPKTNQNYWIPKLNRNKERDKEVEEYYVSLNWNILRIWEHEIKDDLTGALNKIEYHIQKSRILNN
ncbi:very short patch repair endonuclease [Alkalicoccus daliensis]|uniref:Very short patch repair endonuclease n=1 Tax=Alkalicoccus daliensis TaxID=745820 RepID=A0A1H0E920_9BACI|nr:very short patch repair endonuclease [Alkalicoccus daliensis]SDN78947.1 T/G mismatch-specific endonuclease [Alkalicoccus daliensis]